MVSSERIEWIHISFMSRPSTLPCWISEVTKAMARISRISDELKLSSLTRLRISAAEVGTPWRTIGLIWTMTTSRVWQW
ncbi:hypothetical protein D9M72_542870 [compost metagenome]